MIYQICGMQIFMLRSFAKTMSKLHDFIGRKIHVIAVQPPLVGDEHNASVKHKKLSFENLNTQKLQSYMTPWVL